MDSLNHILGLLTSLDTHGFTLLTQLSFSKPSRVKDFWVFTGTSDEQHSPPLTPTTSNLESKREVPSQSYSLIPGPSPLSSGAERRTAPRLPPAPMGNGEATNGHARGASESTPAKASPLKNNTPPFGSLPVNLLRRASAKTRIPSAFNPHKLERSHSSGPRNNNATSASAPNVTASTPMGSSQMMRSLSNPSSIGSVDMTGVGRRSVSVQRTPDVFYVTDGRQTGSPQEHNPFQTSFKPATQPPHAALIKVTTPTDRRASMDSRSPYSEHRPSMLRPAVRRSSTIPTLDTRETSASSIPQLQVHAPSPISAKPSLSSDRTVGRDDDESRAKRAGKGPPQELQLNGPRGRTPTPPLLTPGTFRDSAFSWATGKSQSHDVPITWTGRGPEPPLHGGRSLSFSRDTTAVADTSGDSHVSHRNTNTTVNRQPHTGASGGRPDVDRVSTGPLPPGGWVPPPREDRGDVPAASPYKMFPPTIREQPSQEGTAMSTLSNGAAKQSARGWEMQRGAEVQQKMPERFNVHERPGEVVSGDVGSGISSRARSATTSSMEQPTVSGSSTPKPKAARRDTAMSGWVMVNVEGSGANSQDGSRKKSSSQSPPPRPTVRHRRSNSDSGLMRPQVSKSPVGNAPAPATMSAAAKTIAMIDAVEARKEEAEKSSAPSGFKRIFHRTRGSESEASSRQTTLRRKQADGAIAKGRSLEMEERAGEQGSQENMKTRGASSAVKPGTHRINLD